MEQKMKQKIKNETPLEMFLCRLSLFYNAIAT